MKFLTLALISAQSFLTPTRVRLILFAAALVLGRNIPGLDDFNHGGVGGG